MKKAKDLYNIISLHMNVKIPRKIISESFLIGVLYLVGTLYLYEDIIRPGRPYTS